MDQSAEQLLKNANQDLPPLQHHLPPIPKRNFSLKSLWFASLSSIIFIGVVFIGVIVYARPTASFLSANQRKTLLLLAYHIPFIPKTPEQILLTASESTRQLTRYNGEFSLSAAIGATSITVASIDLKIKGPVDFAPSKKATFNLDIDAGINLAGTAYQGLGHIRKVSDVIYGKIDQLSDSVIDALTVLLSSSSSAPEDNAHDKTSIRKNVTSLFAYWLTYDTKGIESEARKSLDAKSRESSLIDTAKNKIQELLTQSTILPQVKKLKDEQIENTTTYHLSLNLSKETVRQIISDLYGKNNREDVSTQKTINLFADNVESIEINAWIGKTDSILRRLSIQSQIKLDVLTNYYGGSSSISRSPFITILNGVSNPKLSLSSVLTIRTIGKPVVVEQPTVVKSLTEYIQILQDATKTEKQRQQEAQLTQYTNHLKEMEQLLTKHYVQNRLYPSSLSEINRYLTSSTSSLSDQLKFYEYRRSHDGKRFIVYREYNSIKYDYYSPFYGLTSERSYPHQLTKREFDDVE